MQLEVLTHEPETRTHATPLLFVHGKWHGPWNWSEYFLPYFAGCGYAAHALALRGHGKSEGREKLRWTRLARYVEDVAQIASRFDTPPVVIGHSMGGLVVQKYLERYEAPAAVLMASTPPSGALKATARTVRRHPIAAMKSLVTFSLKPVVGTPQLARDVLFSAGTSDEDVGRYFQLLQDDSFCAYLDEILFNLPRTKRINTSMLVMGAENDTLFSVREIQQTAEAYHARIRIFPSMGHDMMLEARWESVAREIADWLAAQKL